MKETESDRFYSRNMTLYLPCKALQLFSTFAGLDRGIAWLLTAELDAPSTLRAQHALPP